MTKLYHEIRDPIHNFFRVTTDERRVIDSAPVQRLRQIHQLAMSYLVYPGASHRRFEHSLGVMELAGRVYDVVTNPRNVYPQVQALLPEIADENKLDYWRRVIRIAGLCHDLGHLPFSHAAEKQLLPEGWNHERLSVEIIRSDEMSQIWESMTPPLRSEDIVKLAVGPKELKGVTFTDWEAILSEIIVGDEFGVDRMDYLLRDSHHAGVPYGRFDHYRLIDTLRVLPMASEGSEEPALGVEGGGLHSAEALLLARYFMYVQMYFHPVRRVYDIHLRDYLSQTLSGGKFSTDLKDHLNSSDNALLVEMHRAATDATESGHDPARRLVSREHFKRLYERNPEDLTINPQAGSAIYQAAVAKFGAENVRRDEYTEKNATPDFPVLTRDERVVSAYSLSQVLRSLPIAAFDYIFVSPELVSDAEVWLQENRDTILRSTAKEEDNGHGDD